MQKEPYSSQEPAENHEDLQPTKYTLEESPSPHWMRKTPLQLGSQLNIAGIKRCLMRRNPNNSPNTQYGIMP